MGTKYFLFCSFIFFLFLLVGCSSSNKEKFTLPSEFEEQEYIWLTWNETGFLQREPFYTTIVEAVKEIHSYTKVKIFYGPQLEYTREQMLTRIYSALLKKNIDASKIELFYNEQAYGAIQDPGPVFLRNKKGELAIADFRYTHPDKRTESIDKNIATAMNLPLVSSAMFSEGGA